MIVISIYGKARVKNIHGKNCGKLPIINNKENSPNLEKTQSYHLIVAFCTFFDK